MKRQWIIGMVIGMAVWAMTPALWAADKVPATAPADAGAAQPIHDLSYHFSVTPNVTERLSDPSGHALSDADPKTHVAWHRRPIVDVDFDFKRMERLDRVAVQTYRPNSGWFVKQISLYVDAGQGYQLVDRIETGQTYKKPSPVKAPYQTFTFKHVDRNALRARVRFEKGGYFSVASIHFFAAAHSAPAETVRAEAAPATAASVKAASATSYRLPEKQPMGAMVREANLDDDPDTELLMANQYVTLVLEPQLGGVISLLKTPDGPSYTPSKSRSTAAGGLLGDHVTSQNYRNGDWTKGAYKYEILDHGPDKVSVRLWCRGHTGTLAYITFSKTITLQKDRSDIRVDYDIQNAPEALVALPQTLWFHNFAGVAGWQTPGTLAYFYPTRKGIEKIDPSSRMGVEEQQWILGPTRGWAALLDVPKKTGLAVSVDYRYLASFYNWWSPNSRTPTLEWRFFEVPIPAGGSFKTTAILQPYAGLSGVSGVSDQAVGQVDYKDGAIHARVSPNFSGTTDLTLRVRRLPETAWREVKTETVNLKADSVTSVTAGEKFSQDGTYVVSALLKRKDKTIFSMETPVTIGKPSGSYALPPIEEQYRPQGKKKLDLQYTSMDVKTPHIQWAKPYHGGKVRAVLFTAGLLDRDIIELAQRMDLDFDTTYIFSTGLQWGLGDYMGRHAATQADLLDGLKDLWARSGDWQVLVLPGEAWQYLPEADRHKILDQVKAGRGLVLVEPSDETAIAKDLPVSGRGKLLSDVPWSKGPDHYITRGIPFSLLPPTDVYTYAHHQGQALISAKGQPVLSVGQVGKGRVAIFEYRASADMSGKGRPAGLMPMAYQTNKDLATPATMSQYYEYQFSLLIRSILWTAHQESSVALETASVAPGRIDLKIANAGKAAAGEITWVLRDPDGRLVGRKGRQPVQLAQGSQTVRLDGPESLPVSKGSMDLWVRDAQGRVLDWGVYPFSLPTPVKLQSVTLAQDHLTPDGEVAVGVKLSGPPPAGTQLRVQLTDGFGREVGATSTPAEKAEQSVTLKFDHLLNRRMEIRVAVWNQRELDSRLLALPVRFALRASPHDNTEPYLLPWTGSASPNRSFAAYLFEPIARQLRGLGTNAAIVNPQERLTGSVFDALERTNMSLFMKGHGIGSSQAAKGSDPDRPVRRSQLYETLDKSVQTVETYARDYANDNGVDYIAGDEGHLAERGVEMSFAPGYLARFRQWLQTQYKSLDELNRQWGSSFGSWDKVMPSTLKTLQGKNSRNFSAWCDFRAFGDYSVAYYNGRMAQAADKAVPGFGMSISGTPYPSPYNGYDYWLLSHALTSVQAYSGMDQLVDFAGRNVDLMKWASGHGLPPSAVKFTIFNQFFRGGTGLSIYAGRLLIKPDLRYSTYGQSFVKYYRPIHEGVGRLLIGSTIQRDRAAILYSQNSMRVDYALGEPDLWKQSNESAAKLLQNIGIDPGWISYAQLDAEHLKKYDLLVLPASSSLSDSEMDAIKGFVERGGIVIGAMWAGVADGHGRVGDRGRLDEWFGIRREGIGLAHGQWTLQGKPLKGMQVTRHETGVQAAGAEVAATLDDGSPVVFHTRHGKGEAWYVACDLLPQYEVINAARTVKSNAEHASAVENLAGQWLAAAKIRPLVRVTDAEGRSLPFVKRTHLADGPVNYYTVLRDYPTASGMSVKPQMATITLPGKAYVYEVLSGKSYGLTDHITAVVADDAAMLFSVLPYQVRKLDVAADQDHVKPGRTVTLHFVVQADAKVGTHVLHVDVITPSGEVSDAYSRNLTAYDGRASMALPFALNDAAGQWTVRARDLTSGAHADVAIQLEP